MTTRIIIVGGSEDLVSSTDSRLTDARTPTTHKTTHSTGGTDPLVPADIGAATAAQGTKADNAAAKALNLSDLASPETARTNLGLGTAATTASTAYATAAQGIDTRTPKTHAATHTSGGTDEISVSGSQITSGTIASARLGSGAAGGGLKALYDDGTYKTPAAGGASDHGALTGLSDDDHTQYHTDARGDARYVKPADLSIVATSGDYEDLANIPVSVDSGVRVLNAGESIVGMELPMGTVIIRRP